MLGRAGEPGRFVPALVLLLGLGCSCSHDRAEAAAAPPQPTPASADTGKTNTASAPGPAPSASTTSDASEATAAAAEPAPPEPPEDMARIPAGPFTMGADSGGEQDEHPAHVVTLEAYWLDKTEVTNAAYRACMDAKVCRPYKAGPWATYGADRQFRGDQQPVVGVSWDDAKTFCEWKGKRLPREAEWEKAARGPGPGGGAEDRTFPWGNDSPDSKKHGVWGRQVTEAVGSYPQGAGPYGNLDMAGNVWEWMEDYYDPYAYRRDTADKGVPGSCEQIKATQDMLRREGMQGFTGTNPIPEGCDRVLRGGAFNYHTRGLRVTNRVHHPGSWRLVMAGFRCAQTEPTSGASAEKPGAEKAAQKSIGD